MLIMGLGSWFLALSGLTNFFTSAFLAAVVLLHNYKNYQNRAYFYLNATIALYSFGYFFWQVSFAENEALFWFKFLTTGLIFINAAYLHFILTLTGMTKSRQREVLLYYFLNIIFAYCNIAGLFYTKLEARYGLGFWPVVTPLFNTYLFFWFWQAFYGLYLLLREWRRSDGTRCEQIKYLTIAALMVFAACATNWPLWYNINFFPLTILISANTVAAAYAIIKLRFLNIALLTIRGIFFIIYGTIAAIPIFLGYLTKEWFHATLLAALAGGLGNVTYKWLVGNAENRLMSRQRQYQEMLRGIAYNIALYHDKPHLIKYTVDACVGTAQLSSVRIFLIEQDEKYFNLVASENTADLADAEPIQAHDPIVRQLKEGSNCVNIEAALLENVSPENNEYAKNLTQFSKKYGSSLVFPIRARNTLLGMLWLGPKTDGSIFTQDDIDALSLMTYQFALALENCRYLDEIKGLYEKAVTDKLTGCYNRMFYEEYLERSVAESNKKGTSLYLIVLDINYFKHMNDTYGHNAGDRVLSTLGAMLKRCFRPGDVVFRSGGDEFGSVISDITREKCEEIVKNLVAETTRQEVVISSDQENISIKFSISIGITALKKDQTSNSFFQSADTALFEAKNSGRIYHFSH